MYFQNGEYHREDGPATVLYYESGNVKQEKYFQRDELHRIDGPAVIKYNEDGSILNTYYFYYDEETSQEYLEALQRKGKLQVDQATPFKTKI